MDRYMRLFLDPAPTDGGGSTADPAPTDQQIADALERLGIKLAAPAPAPAVNPDVATIGKAELARLRGLEQKARDDAEAERKKAEAAAVKNGEWETIVKSREAEAEALRRTLADSEAVNQRSLIGMDLAVNLAGKPLVPGAADQLLKLWAGDFKAVRDGDVYRIVSADNRPVADVVAERLASAAYAHFLAPTSRPGVKIDGAQQTTATPTNEAPTMPKNLGDAILRTFLDNRQAQGPLGSPRGFHRVN